MLSLFGLDPCMRRALARFVFSCRVLLGVSAPRCSSNPTERLHTRRTKALLTPAGFVELFDDGDFRGGPPG